MGREETRPVLHQCAHHSGLMSVFTIVSLVFVLMGGVTVAPMELHPGHCACISLV